MKVSDTHVLQETRKHSVSEAFMFHVLVFILIWIIPSLILNNTVLSKFRSLFLSHFLCHMCSWVNTAQHKKHMLVIIFSLVCISSLMWVSFYDLSHESQANQIYAQGNIIRILEKFAIDPTCSVCLDS